MYEAVGHNLTRAEPGARFIFTRARPFLSSLSARRRRRRRRRRSLPRRPVAAPPARRRRPPPATGRGPARPVAHTAGAAPSLPATSPPAPELPRPIL
jgi:hypothetical protein